MNSQLVLLHCSLITGVGPVLIENIVRVFEKQARPLTDLYNLSVDDLIAYTGVSLGAAQKIVTGLQDVDTLEREITLLHQHTISWVSNIDPAYPQLLKSIYGAPTVIYYQGPHHVLSDSRAIAVIGSRKADNYGKRIIEQLIPPLLAQSMVIVSGGALGADSMAHEITVNNGGKTIAVLGSGLLRPYPQSNKKLFENILANGGVLVSPFPVYMEAMPGNFPARNRIISGLSRGCIVIQAAEKSGACITARCALEQGRDVFAVPGPLGDPLSIGCNRLIQEGARLICDAQDILQELDLDYRSSGLGEVQKTITELTHEYTFNNTGLIKKPEKPEKFEKTSYQKIIEHCKLPVSVDELIALMGLELAIITDLLFDLQLEGLIVQDGSGMWKSS